MDDKTKLAAVVVATSVGAGLLAAALVFLAIWLRRRRASVSAGRTRSLESSTATLRAANGNGADSSVSESAADWGHNPLPAGKRVAFWGWRGGDHHAPLSVSGIPKYHYKDLQKATNNFTMILGQGSFGPVYKAVMATGEVVAVKALASDFMQGEREFHRAKTRRSKSQVAKKIQEKVDTAADQEDKEGVMLEREMHLTVRENFLSSDPSTVTPWR